MQSMNLIGHAKILALAQLLVCKLTGPFLREGGAGVRD